jgi:formamidopyrimidine-DNA glycosylase
MPELPDVEVFRRHLASHGLHRPIARVEVVDPYLLRDTSRQRLGRALKRAELVGTRRHGKHLFAETSRGGSLVLHFGMTGFLQHCGKEEPRPQHTRFVLHFDDGSQLAFADQRKLGFVSYTADAEAFVDARDLGEDALRLSQPALRELLRSRRGALKSALMDQSLISGIGNIYSDEILFQAKLNPKLGAADLDAAGYRRLHRQLCRVLQLAADRGADPARLPRSWLLLHREDGAPCPRNNGQVRKFRMSGRGGFYCPSCQPG